MFEKASGFNSSGDRTKINLMDSASVVLPGKNRRKKFLALSNLLVKHHNGFVKLDDVKDFCLSVALKMTSSYARTSAKGFPVLPLRLYSLESVWK